MQYFYGGAANIHNYSGEIMKRQNFKDYMRGFVCYFDHLCKLITRVASPKEMEKLTKKQYAKDCVLYLANMEYLTEHREYNGFGIDELLNEIGALLFPGVDEKPKRLEPIKVAVGKLCKKIRGNVKISIDPEALDNPTELYGAATVDFYLRCAETANYALLSYARTYYSYFEDSFRNRQAIVRDKKGQIMLKRSEKDYVSYVLVTPADIKSRKFRRNIVCKPVKDHPGFALAGERAEDQHVDIPYKQSFKKQKAQKVRPKRTKRAKSTRSAGDTLLSLLGILAWPFVKLGKGAWYLITHIGKAISAIWSAICSLPRGVKKLGRRISSSRRDDGGLTTFSMIVMGIGALYVILELTGLIYKMSFPVGDMMLTEFYHFNLTRLAVSWLKAVDHGFLSAITLGLLQIILIVIGAIADVAIYIILFILSILIMIALIVLQLIYLMALPVIACIIAIVKFIRSDEKSALSAVFILTAIALTVLYFVNIAPAL